jgi:hypothetical protein
MVVFQKGKTDNQLYRLALGSKCGSATKKEGCEEMAGQDRSIGEVGGAKAGKEYRQYSQP